MELLVKMQLEREKANVVSFSSAIYGCGNGSRWEKALQLLAKVQMKRVRADVVDAAAAREGQRWELQFSHFCMREGQPVGDGFGVVG